ncbi:nucleoside hydrolase [Varibaculum vaginae]|uniref:nucleoside hydrolase n=1 Tax=Varibaculum vaginae TaxID=2364797 RepID=UPI000F097157|nr:nucleoside hydrolase [Varibaculum vaginae]
MPLIIDCDPGNGIPGANVDDALALCLAWSASQLEVSSVWTVFGNVTAAEAVNSAQFLADTFRVNTPILKGCDRPLDTYRAPSKWREKLDAPRFDSEILKLWGKSDCFKSGTISAQEDTSVSEDEKCEPPEQTALRLAKDILRNDSESSITIAALGPLTNIAALIRFQPDAAKRIKEIFLMGGCLGYGDLVDTNFAIDPLAASIVLRSGIKVTIVPIDVTRTTHMSLEYWLNTLEWACKYSQNVDRAMTIDSWLRPWIKYSDRTRPVDGMWVHDMVVIAHLLCPDITQVTSGFFKLSPHPKGKLIQIPNDGPAINQNFGSSKQLKKKLSKAQVITSVDNDRLLSLWKRAVFSCDIPPV